MPHLFLQESYCTDAFSKDDASFNFLHVVSLSLLPSPKSPFLFPLLGSRLAKRHTWALAFLLLLCRASKSVRKESELAIADDIEMMEV